MVGAQQKALMIPRNSPHKLLVREATSQQNEHNTYNLVGQMKRKLNLFNTEVKVKKNENQSFYI